MPVFNRPPEETTTAEIDHDARAKQEAADLKPEIARIEEHVSKDDKRRRQSIQDAKLGCRHNEAVAEQASRRRSEEAVVREFAIAKGARRTRKGSDKAGAKSKKANGWQAVRLIIWGHLRIGKDRNKPPRDLEQRYEIKRVDNEVQYWLRSTSGEPTIAFVETDNLVTVSDTGRQVNIDALRIAEDKYSRVRIAGTQRAALDTVRIAAELGIVLEDEQAETGKAHLDAIAGRSAAPILDVSWRFYATRDDRRRARQAAAQARDKRVDTQTGLARPALGMSLEGLIAVYLEREPTRSIAKGDDPILIEAWRKLDEDIDHNRLFLAASRYHKKFEGQEYRFLDDERLARAFGSEPEVLVDREIQNRLRAIEAIQLDKRRLIAAALISGAARIVDGELEIEERQASWAKDFWRAQRSDPIFHRLIQVARARPDRFAYDPGLQPGEAPRRRALIRGDHVLAKDIGRELTRQSQRNGGFSNVQVDEPPLPAKRPAKDTPPPEENAPPKPGLPQSPTPDHGQIENSRRSKPLYPTPQGVER
nr:LPD7 domain-containing protein [Citromicrobium bathyomarinum]